MDIDISAWKKAISSFVFGPIKLPFVVVSALQSVLLRFTFKATPGTCISNTRDPATERIQNSLFVHRVVPQKFRNCKIPGRTGGLLGVQGDIWEYSGKHGSAGGYMGVQGDTWKYYKQGNITVQSTPGSTGRALKYREISGRTGVLLEYRGIHVSTGGDEIIGVYPEMYGGHDSSGVYLGCWGRRGG